MPQLTPAQQLQYYQNQLANAQRNLQQFSGSNTNNSTAGLLQQVNDLSAKVASLQSAANPSSTGTTDPVADAKIRVTKDTEGRGDATMQDPYLQAVAQRLDDVSSGKDAPFTQAVQSQMMSARAGATAAGEAAQNESLREQAAANGGNAADPSYRAAQRQLHQQSQSQNQNDLGQIQTQAQLSNFGARQDATRALDSARLGQVGEANRNYNLGASYYSKIGDQGQHTPAFQYQPQPLMTGIGSYYGANNGFQYQSPGASQTAASQPAPPTTDPAFQFTPMDDSSWATGAVDNSSAPGSPVQVAGGFQFDPNANLVDTDSNGVAAPGSYTVPGLGQNPFANLDPSQFQYVFGS